MAVSPVGFKYFFFDYRKLEEHHLRLHRPDGGGEKAWDDQVAGHAVFVTFQGADASAMAHGIAKLSTYYNYYLGDDPARWASGVSAWQGILYESVYPGVDLKVRAVGDHVKYDWVVAPGADPRVICMTYQGAEKIIHGDGDLSVKTPLAEITEKKPSAFQIINGRKHAVTCDFLLEGESLSFSFPDGFDPCYELVIDPLLIFSTYSGSTADNWGSTATPGEHGDLYSSGVTEQSNGGVFPATAGAFQTTSGGLYDIGILKYDSAGTTLLYATYLGGSDSESPHSLIVNSNEELIVLGTTSSSDFPTSETAYRRVFTGGQGTSHVVDYDQGSDIVLARLNREGTVLMASTYVGGSRNDGLNPTTGELTQNYGDQLRGDVVTDDDGNIYVSSVTASDDLFPDSLGFQPAYGGGPTDGILFKIDAQLSQMLWGTYLGGSGADAAHTLKLDAQKNVVLAGGTDSPDFPVTMGTYQTGYNGGVDGWIARVAADGSGILQSTFTGTANYDQIYFLDRNANGEVYVYGQTAGTFPVTPGVYSNPGSGQFVQKFDSTLSTLVFSTVFGAGRGEPDISPTAFLVNECNNLYMCGWGGVVNSGTGFWNTGTRGMVTTPDAFQSTTSGSDFYFIVLTDDARELLYATFFGGTLSRTHVDGGTSRFDKDGIVYHSVCAGCAAFNATQQATSDFPTTPGAWSRSNNSYNCNNAAFKFDLSSLKARIRTNSFKRDMPGLKEVCFPDPVIFENRSIGGEIFHWDFGDGTTLSTPDTTFINHRYQQPGVYTIKLKAIDQGTCKGVDETSAIITVKDMDFTVQEDADVCFGSPFRLQASGAALYAWSSEDKTFVSHEASPAVHPKDTTAYFVTLTEANGCARTDTVVLNVIPGIEPRFEWDKERACMARPDIVVRNVTDSLQSGDLLFFDFGDGSTSDNAQEEHAYSEDGVYNIRLVARREFCVYEKAITVPVFELFIPNVITPAARGSNDVFTIRYGKNEGVTPGDYGFKVALKIYNRWGRPVYETDDYHYDWSGQGLDAGIYFYEVSIEGHATCKSWLQLIN